MLLLLTSFYYTSLSGPSKVVTIEHWPVPEAVIFSVLPADTPRLIHSAVHSSKWDCQILL